jgi:hypothetical protein
VKGPSIQEIGREMKHELCRRYRFQFNSQHRMSVTRLSTLTCPSAMLVPMECCKSLELPGSKKGNKR